MNELVQKPKAYLRQLKIDDNQTKSKLKEQIAKERKNQFLESNMTPIDDVHL